jgi:hypothetical protein
MILVSFHKFTFPLTRSLAEWLVRAYYSGVPPGIREAPGGSRQGTSTLGPGVPPSPSGLTGKIGSPVFPSFEGAPLIQGGAPHFSKAHVRTRVGRKRSPGSARGDQPPSRAVSPVRRPAVSWPRGASKHEAAPEAAHGERGQRGASPQAEGRRAPPCERRHTRWFLDPGTQRSAAPELRGHRASRPLHPFAAPARRGAVARETAETPGVVSIGAPKTRPELAGTRGLERLPALAGSSGPSLIEAALKCPPSLHGVEQRSVPCPCPCP